MNYGQWHTSWPGHKKYQDSQAAPLNVKQSSFFDPASKWSKWSSIERWTEDTTYYMEVLSLPENFKFDAQCSTGHRATEDCASESVVVGRSPCRHHPNNHGGRFTSHVYRMKPNFTKLRARVVCEIGLTTKNEMLVSTIYDLLLLSLIWPYLCTSNLPLNACSCMI